MAYTINYNGTTTWSDSLTIESLGNVCLHAIDELDYSYFFVARTLLGETSYVEFGPLRLGDSLLPDEYNVKFERFEYSNNKLIKLISQFIRPKKNMIVKSRKVKITSIEEVDVDYALSCGVDVISYIKDYSETSNY